MASESSQTAPIRSRPCSRSHTLRVPLPLLRSVAPLSPPPCSAAPGALGYGALKAVWALGGGIDGTPVWESDPPPALLRFAEFWGTALLALLAVAILLALVRPWGRGPERDHHRDVRSSDGMGNGISVVRRVMGMLFPTVALLCAAGADGVAAQEPVALTAPAYPGNTLMVQREEPLVAGTVSRVKLSGHARWNDPATDPFDSGYGLWLYVQDAAVDPACEPWFGPQLQKAINIDVNATTASSGFVMQGEQEVQREPTAQELDWSTDSAPFTVELGVRRVLLCAYQRYIIDDVASYQLPLRVEQPACRPVRKRVHRTLRLDCNVSGDVKVHFAGRGIQRAVPARLSTRNGNGTATTRRLRPGRYRVTVRTGQLTLGRPFAIRVTH